MRRLAALFAGIAIYALFAFAIDRLYRPDPEALVRLATCGAEVSSGGATYDPREGLPDVAPFYRRLHAPETVRLCGSFSGQPGLLVLPRLAGNALVVRIDGGQRLAIGAVDRPANFWVQPHLVPLDGIAPGEHRLEVEIHGLYDVGVRLPAYTASWASGGLRAAVLHYLTSDLVSIAAGLNLGVGVLLFAYGLQRRRQRIEAVLFGAAALAAVVYVPDYMPSSGALGLDLFLVRRKLSLAASFVFGSTLTWGLELSTRSRLRIGPIAFAVTLFLAVACLASPSQVALKTVATIGSALFLPLSAYATFLAARFLEPRFAWLWVFFGASTVHLTWNLLTDSGYLYLFHYGMLAAALGGGIRLTSQLASIARELGRATHAALTDPLTGARNRAFCENLAVSPADVVALVDFDGFKEVNDRFGHERGDRLLVDFVRAARQRLRGTDHVVRLGGDEFALVFRLATLTSARRICDEVIASWKAGSSDVPVGASFGLVEGRGEPLERALAEADRAMYAAKREKKGRGREEAGAGAALLALATLTGAAFFAAGCGKPAPREALDLDAGKVRAFAVEPALDGSPRAVAVAHRVELGSDWRVVRAVDAGADTDFVVEIAASSRTPLRLAFAAGVRSAEGGSSRAHRFVVEKEGGGEPLWERRIGGTVGGGSEAGVEPAGRWVEGEIELAALPATLRFRSEAGAGAVAALSESHAFWADVHLVAPTVEAARSLLLISVDTLRADRLSLYGRGPRETTPRIDAWARRRAVAFDQAIAASPWTLPSHASIFTGLEATRHGVENEMRVGAVRLAGVGRTAPFLAERARDAGLRTVAAVGGGLLAPQFGLGAGFDVYRSWPGVYESHNELSSGVAAILEAIRAGRGRPALYLLHTYRVHEPYERGFGLGPIGEGDRRAGSKTHLAVDFSTPIADDGFRQDDATLVEVDPATRTRRPFDDLDALGFDYDAGVRSMDREIGGLLETLESEGLDRGLTVVLTSDHGEALGEAGRLGHHDLAEATIRVPLLLATDSSAPRRVETQVRHVDLLPTMLEALGLAVPSGLDGVSLLGFARGETPAVPPDAWSYSSTWNHGLSLRRGPRKFFVDDTAWASRRTTRFSFVNLDRDPFELSPVPIPAASVASGPHSRPLARAVAHFEESAGLWIELTNRTPRELELGFEGADLVLDSVKTIDDRLRLHHPARGRIAVAVAPGASAWMRWTRRTRHPLRVVLLEQGRERTRATLVATDLERDLDLAWTGQRWSTEIRDPQVPVALAFRWRGAIDPAAPLPPLPPKDASAEQLRALGYLN